MRLTCDAVTQVLRVRPDRAGRVVVSQGDMHNTVTVSQLPPSGAGEIRFDIDGVTRKAVMVMANRALHLGIAGASFVFVEASAFPDSASTQDARRACAPVAGKITQVQVDIGTQVVEGQNLVCVEAMKMEMWAAAQASGKVTAVHVKPGDQVESGAVLLELEISPAVLQS
jgi:geranyl-CoA carboxylase alpha subunit